MKIKFQGKHDVDDLVASLDGMLKLFQEKYGIDNFDKIEMDLTLLDNDAEPVEIIDATTNEVFDVFEVVKSEPDPKPKLWLAVDNTLH